MLKFRISIRQAKKNGGGKVRGFGVIFIERNFVFMLRYSVSDAL
jgi:hypothetical protein